MNSLPQSPKELLKELFNIFPDYRDCHIADDDGHDPTYHSVLLDFTCFFGKNARSFSEKQLRLFGTLVSEAVMQPGPLENAFGTCLLEHLHQIKAESVLRPYLSKMVRGKTRA